MRFLIGLIRYKSSASPWRVHGLRRTVSLKRLLILSLPFGVLDIDELYDCWCYMSSQIKRKVNSVRLETSKSFLQRSHLDGLNILYDKKYTDQGLRARKGSERLIPFKMVYDSDAGQATQILNLIGKVQLLREIEIEDKLIFVLHRKCRWESDWWQQSQ